MNENDFNQDGLNVGLQNIDILNGTDVGLTKNRGSSDKSKYERITKPDGTVIEKVNMNKKSKNKGIGTLTTDGVSIGENALNAALSKEVSEDVVSFVDSIWGSKQAAAKTQDTRQQKLENFKNARGNQFAIDSAIRKAAIENEQQITRGL